MLFLSAVMRRVQPRSIALALTGVLILGCASSTSPVTPVGTTRPSPPPSASAATVYPLATPNAPTFGPTPAAAPQTSLEDILAGMTTDEKIGQLFMVSFYGDVANETNTAQVRLNREGIGADNIAQAIAKYHLGGVIYFTWAGNLASASQIAALSNSIQQTAAAQSPSIPLLVATDQEGGSIVRLPSPATRFPGNMALGATNSTDLARSTGKAIGEELRAVGINDVL